MTDTITLDGNAYRIAELNLNQLETLAAELDHISAVAADQSTEKVLAASRAFRTIISAALSKHHPDMTPEAVGNMLTIATRDAAFRTIMVHSGLQSPEPSAAA